MSFIFSRALVEASLQDSYSDADAFALSNGSPTLRPCLWHDRTTERFPLSRFGMTCAPLTDGLGRELLMWWLEGSRARTSAQPEVGQVSTVNGVVSGQKWQGSFARYDREKSSWKTPQYSLLGDSDEFSETWPRWGSMRNGVSYLRQIPALPICESESGLWPTPTCDSATQRTNRYAQGGMPLTAAIRLWPTPTVHGNYNCKGASQTSGDGLATAVKLWPTQCASASKGSSPAALVRKDGRSRQRDRIDHAVMASDGGQLNPEWVEWLMGWPIGHTALKPLEMARYREWLRQHGESLGNKDEQTNLNPLPDPNSAVPANRNRHGAIPRQAHGDREASFRSCV